MASESPLNSTPIQERASWYQKILELNSLIQREGSIETIFNYLMDDAIAASGAERGYMFLLEGNRISVLTARHSNHGDVTDALNQISETVVRKLLELKAPLIVSDASVDPELRDAKSVVALKLRSILALPLYFQGKMVGILYLENRDQGSFFSPAVVEILSIFGTQASAVISTRSGEIQSIKQRRKRDQTKDLGVAEFETSIRSSTMKAVLDVVEKVAKSDANVLITGETGTGKERVAKLIHAKSRRERAPFVAVNCGAIPDNLLESEFFGYVKGAFTGAVDDRPGLVQKANGGTLFLDEIGDLPLHLQVKLLRVIQENEVLKLGATSSEKVDLRVISATNRNLEVECKEERFRQDLYFRINNVHVHLPPLRERIEDLEYLVDYFRERISEECQKQITRIDPAALELLIHYEWPGNIRELENVIRRAVILSDGPVITIKELDSIMSDQPIDAIQSLSKAKNQFIRDYIKKAIIINQGNKTKAAKALGVDPRTLYRHLSDEEPE